MVGEGPGELSLRRISPNTGHQSQPLQLIPIDVTCPEFPQRTVRRVSRPIAAYEHSHRNPRANAKTGSRPGGGQGLLGSIGGGEGAVDGKEATYVNVADKLSGIHSNDQ